jgi:DNA repair exonuclease SbcCD ATPase subunit
MGASKRLLEELQEQRARKEEALLEVPEALDDAIRIIGELHDDVRVSHKEIEDLQKQLRLACTWRAKLHDWIFSGIIGAVIGILVGLLLHLL